MSEGPGSLPGPDIREKDSTQPRDVSPLVPRLNSLSLSEIIGKLSKRAKYQKAKGAFGPVLRTGISQTCPNTVGMSTTTQVSSLTLI